MRKIATVSGLILALSWLLSSCAAPVAPPTGPATAGLRIALLPVIDALPMYVAQAEGLFQKHGVGVEFIPVASAPERDQLIVAGQADGMINEALSTALYNKEKAQVQIVRFARAASQDTPLFSILASSKSEIANLQALKGVPIGVSQGTVIEYLTDRLLQAEGFSPGDIQTIAVPKIPDRINLLGSGELQAGMLPEPATSLAISQGAKLILNDSAHPQYSFSVITFRKAAIDANPEAIRGFLRAIEEAVDLINAEPARWANLLVEQKVMPPALADKFRVPTFIPAGVPSQAQWNDMLAWAKDKGLLTADVPYTDAVTPAYLPK